MLVIFIIIVIIKCYIFYFSLLQELISKDGVKWAQ